MAEPAAITAMEIWTTAGAVCGLLLLSAFFSGSETALTAASRARLQHIANDKAEEKSSNDESKAINRKAAKTALNLTEDSEKLIGGILLGNNIVNILATSLAASLLTALFSEGGVVMATIVMTVLIVVFAEVTPKTYAISQPETAAMAAARPIAIVVKVLSPVVAVVQVIVRVTLGLLGVKIDPEAQILGHEEIRGAIDLHHSEGAVAREARDRLLGALELDDREVNQVMIHRRNIFMLDIETPTEEILDKCVQSPYTRIPLYKENPENIVGILHAKDLLRMVDQILRQKNNEPTDSQLNDTDAINAIDIHHIVMEPWFAPDTTSLSDQLRAFLVRKSHFALVVDEYGSLQGLVTLEDILEEIVGEIADEHDDEVEGVTREASGAYVLDGQTPIRELNRTFDWNLPDDEATTIAGLVIHEAQAIPTEGQLFSFHGFRFEILERKRHQITKLRLRPVTATEVM